MARKGAEGNARQEHLSCVEHILTLPQRQSHLHTGARTGPLSSVQKKKTGWCAAFKGGGELCLLWDIWHAWWFRVQAELSMLTASSG